MKTKPIHDFLWKRPADASYLFDGTRTLLEFCKKLEERASAYVSEYDDPDSDDDEEKDDSWSREAFLGEGFELFVEVMMLLNPNDIAFPSNYTPAVSAELEQSALDYGVDATGTNPRGEKAVIQVKYRKNRHKDLYYTKSGMGNLACDGMFQHGVVSDPTDRKNIRHFVFTTARGINRRTYEAYRNQIKCFGFASIAKRVDNNVPFWQNAHSLVNPSTQPQDA